MYFQPTKIPGVFILQLRKLTDERGYFARAWCSQELTEQGLDARCVQINTAVSLVKGTVRGMHYQLSPHSEVKLVRCPRGALFDVAVDLRPDSPTVGEWVGVELSAENGTMLYIPEGCAHGFQTLTDDTEMTYQTSAFFSGEHARGVRFDDPRFAIEWPLPVTCISEKDRVCPDWNPPSAVYSAT